MLEAGCTAAVVSDEDFRNGKDFAPLCPAVSAPDGGLTIPIKVYAVPGVAEPPMCWLWADLRNGLQEFCCDETPASCPVVNLPAGEAGAPLEDAGEEDAHDSGAVGSGGGGPIPLDGGAG